MHFPVQPVAILAYLLVLVTATTALNQISPTTLSTLPSTPIITTDRDPPPTDVTTSAKKPCTICIDKLNTCHNKGKKDWEYCRHEQCMNSWNFCRGCKGITCPEREGRRGEAVE